MSAYNFGVGTAIGRRTDIVNPTPAFLGVLQDIELSFDQTLKDLVGQFKLPVDVAPANLKITGKAKLAVIQANMMNDLFFGATLTAAAGIQMATQETATTATTTFTVTNAATFKEDLGVFYKATGVQLKRVATSPVTGQYSVVETTGVYTIAVGDENTVFNVFYTYGVTTKQNLAMANEFMGQGPSFELNIQEQYTNNAGVVGTIFIKLNACRSSKFTLPFKNTEYTIPEFVFMAYADTAGNWGTIATTE